MRRHRRVLWAAAVAALGVGLWAGLHARSAGRAPERGPAAIPVTDAVAVVTGCRLGKRALKFRDWGKMAATFVDVSTGKAIRISAKESSKALARKMHPEIENKNQQQMLAYREMSEDDLFQMQWVRVELPPEEFPGYKGERIACDACGEGINFRREVCHEGRVLCRSCAGEAYYTSL